MEQVIEITKVQVGHVVGKGGATIKEIQSTTGAKLEIIDGPKVYISAENESSVTAAAARVKEIIAAQENPNYEGPTGAKLRAEADALGATRAKLFQEATNKRAAGEVSAANNLVQAAKEVGAQMEAKHCEAAAAIARFNNEEKGRGDDSLDLHGLRKAEALQLLKERITKLRTRAVDTPVELEVITGAGHHSAPGQQKLKAATEAFLKAEGLKYTEASAGSLNIIISGTGKAATTTTTAAATNHVAAAVEGEEKAAKQAINKEKKEAKKKCEKCCTVM